MSAMSAQDRLRWDERYADRGPAATESAHLPAVFEAWEPEFPTCGRALELACGQGGATVWLARRGLQAWGVDASPVAIGQARALAEHWQVAGRCHFDVVDLDAGLPPGPAVDVVLCHRFRAPHLNTAVVERLNPGGLLAISLLSEVGAAAGPYRAAAGELTAAFADLEVLSSDEGDGIAWLVGRRR